MIIRKRWKCSSGLPRCSHLTETINNEFDMSHALWQGGLAVALAAFFVFIEPNSINTQDPSLNQSLLYLDYGAAIGELGLGALGVFSSFEIQAGILHFYPLAMNGWMGANHA